MLRWNFGLVYMCMVDKSIVFSMSTERKKRARRMEAESDTTEFETSHSASSSPRRRGRVKHRGRQRGQMVGKRTLRMGTFPR